MRKTPFRFPGVVKCDEMSTEMTNYQGVENPFLSPGYTNNSRSVMMLSNAVCYMVIKMWRGMYTHFGAEYRKAPR